jgi:hypothetical protein
VVSFTTWPLYPPGKIPRYPLDRRLSEPQNRVGRRGEDKDIWGSGGIDPRFLTSALDGGEWSASRPCRFTSGERAPGTYWVGGWVGPRAAFDSVEKRKIVHCLESNPGRPARSPSLYRLSYPGSKKGYRLWAGRTC